MAARTCAAIAIPALLACAAVSAGGPGASSRQVATGAAAMQEGAVVGGGALRFVREVSPFPVFRSDGEAWDLPFLGGLDVPRPQFVDIDGDADYDLFLQEYPDQLWYFENVGTAAAPEYEWRSNRWQDLAIGEWFRFHDLDADGDADLLAEVPYSYVKHYRNEGTATQPRLVYVDSLRDASGDALFMDRQNIPAIGDLDCDGKVEILIGRVEGTVSRYAAVTEGAERFVFQGDNFEGIEIIGQVDMNGSQRHGANALALADHDGDGDLDLYWGDYFERGVLLIENVGATCSTPSFQSEPVLLRGADTRTSGYNIPAPVDLDRDGDMDFLMGVLGGAYNPFLTAANNFYHWERTGAEAYELRAMRFLDGIDIGSESAPALADIDGDGDLDMVVGNKLEPANTSTGRLHVFRNDGTATTPRFVAADTLALVDAFHQKPAFADLDGDGDLDLLLGTWNDGVLYFRNTGTREAPVFVQDTALSVVPERASNVAPALGDVDGDGDLDLFIGESSGEINYYRNDGSARAPRFTLVSGRLDDIDVGRSAAPSVVDIDGDGLLDLVVGRDVAGVAAYRNSGTAGSPRFIAFEEFTLPLPPLSVPAFADVDGDGTVDLFSGTASGGVLFFRGGK